MSLLVVIMTRNPAGAKPMEQKKLQVAIVLSLGVKVVMESHNFMVGDTIYCQTHSGAIRLELTMEKMEAMRIPLQMAGRYMDDHNISVQKEYGKEH